ncbi:MAG: aldo/keto reductase [Gammaproteobacteria bacterium]
MTFPERLSRRELIKTLAALCASVLVPATKAVSREKFISKPVPSTGEAMPVIGLGSSRTFNVGDDIDARDNCAEVIRHFLNAGGRMIDSSPMYGSSQPVIGYALDKLGKSSEVFSADKVWIPAPGKGRQQMEASRRYWGVPGFDLMQVHNLVSWQEHLENLYEMKDNGNIRYVGITTSHGRRHKEFEEVMKSRELDFVQFSYNLVDREAERRLLPLAAERGIAVIVNRPFQRGDLIHRLEEHPLPGWAGEIGCANWPQFLLKFIVSHPAVTCAIPATSQVEHVKENMGACHGVLPDAGMRARMIAYVENL